MNKAVFLDRDGTINVDYGYVHKMENFELLPDAVSGMQAFQKMGYLLILITNQSGIGRGYFSEEEYLRFQDQVDSKLKSLGVNIAGYYYCSDVDDKSERRKPNTGMFYEAARDFNLSFESCIAIGDRERDLSICKVESVRGFLIGEECESAFENVSSVLEAAKHVEKSQFIREEVKANDSRIQ